MSEQSSRYTKEGLPKLTIETLQTAVVELQRSINVSVKEETMNRLERLAAENPLVAAYVISIPDNYSDFFPTQEMRDKIAYILLVLYDLLKSQANNYKVQNMIEKFEE